MDTENKPFGLAGWLSVLVAFCCTIAAVVLYVSLSDMKTSNEALEASLLERRGEYAKMEDSELTVEYLQQLLHSAKDAGESVANSINAAHDVVWNASGENINWTDVYDEMRSCLSGVSTYFSSSVENGASWFACHDPETGDKSQWTFMTTYSFSARTMDCVWLCRRQSDNQIMAYVSATFDSDKGIFENVAHHVTIYGSTWQNEFVS